MSAGVPPEAPPALREALAGAKPDFVVRAGRSVGVNDAAARGVIALLAVVLGATIALDVARGGEAQLGTLAVFGVFLALVGIEILRVLRAVLLGPAWWAGTAEALVRVRRDEVRSLAWSEFGVVAVARGKSGRGTVFLVPRSRFLVIPRTLRAKEGRVRLPGRLGLALLDVPDLERVEHAVRARVAAALRGA